MQITVETDPIGPLSVLRALPDARLAMLEGLNGIGKTLAVRVLLACTGSVPYPRESASWRSFCAGLGPFEVRITDLNRVAEMHFRADTRDWLDLDPDSSLPFQQVSIDGRTAELREIRQLLTVERIAGDEGIVDTLANQAVADADRVNRWSRQVAGSSSGALASLERALHEGNQAVGEWSGASYTAAQGTVARFEKNTQTCDADAAGARARHAVMRDAVDLQARVASQRQRSPQLGQRLAAVDTQILEAQAKREAVQALISRLAGKVAGAARFVKELTLARRNLERHQRTLSDATVKASAIASSISIPPERGAAELVLTELRATLGELAERQQEFDAAPAMRAVLDQISTQLAQAEDRGLSEQVVIEDVETGLELTVNQARHGVMTRRRVLEGRPPPPEAARIAEEIKQLQRRQARVAELLSQLEATGRFRRLVTQAEERLENALRATDPKAYAELQKAEAQRRAYDETILALASERASLVQQLGGDSDSSLEALSVQLAAAMASLGVAEPSELEPLADAAQEAALTADSAAATAREQLSRARRERARADADIKRAGSLISSSPSLSWLTGRAVGNGVEPTDASIVALLSQLDTWRELLASVEERLGSHRGQLAAVEAALRGIARQLRGEELRAARYVPELQRWFSGQLEEWFNSPRIRRELLPRATGDIQVDLADAQVLWKEATGAKARPLEAFSSGEQAFAYTRARLGQLDEQNPRPANRLIVLDEFGAFMAHDRFGALLTYLRERAEAHPEDQVLVVLPLNRDYAQLAQSSVGDDAGRFADLAAQVASRSYAVQALV